MDNISAPPSGRPKENVVDSPSWKEYTFQMEGTEECILLHQAEGTCFVINKDIEVVVSRHKQPAFNLHLILKRLPMPQENNVIDLLDRAVLTFSMQVGLKESILSLPKFKALKCKPLYAQEILYTLKTTDGKQTLAKATSSGIQGRAQLVTHLDRQQSLEVLDALEGSTVALVIEAEIKYKVKTLPKNLQLYGNWSEIYNALKQRATDNTIAAEVVKDALSELIAKNTITLSPKYAGEMEQNLLEIIYRHFMIMSGIIFQKEELNGQKELLTFKAPPHKAFFLDYSFAFEKRSFETLKLETKLDKALKGLTTISPFDKLVHLTAKDGEAGMLKNVPSRITVDTVNRLSRNPAAKPGYIFTQGSIKTLQQAASGTSSKDKQAVMGSMLKPSAVSGITQVENFHEAELSVAGGKVLSMPVVDDAHEAIWQDPKSPQLLWYPPTLKLIIPDKNASPQESPFLFNFERIGTTASGTPALRGHLKIKLRMEMPDQVQKFLNKGKVKFNTKPVQLEEIAIIIQIPFMDKKGKARYHDFHAKVKQEGNVIIAETQLLNEWVQLTYGAIANKKFQAIEPRVRWVYRFKAYTKLEKEPIKLLYGGKYAHIPVVFASEHSPNNNDAAYIDAATLTLKSPTTEIRFKKEQKAMFRQQERGNKLPLAKIQAAIIHPQIEPHPKVKAQLAIAEYIEKSSINKGEVPIHISCEEFGHLYRERKEGESNAIGCTEISKLGQIEYRQYKEITDLKHDDYKVYKSLQLPDQYLVVPSRFAIRRQEDGDGTVKPVIYLYSTLDASTPDNSSISLFASLQPDIPVYERALLLNKLKALSPEPEIYYPTDVPVSSVEANWLLNSSIAPHQDMDTINAGGPFITVNFTVNIVKWPLMQDMLSNGGVSGNIVFTLPDYTNVSSDLILQLNTLRGPWNTGPLSVKESIAKVKLINKINQAVEISDIYRVSGAILEQMPVEILLEADQEKETEVDWNNDDTFLPVYQYLPADPVTIEESRSFVEDIFQNVAFINLIPLKENGLERINIQCRMENTKQIYRAQVTEGMPVVEIQFILSLTTYIQNKFLEMRFTSIGKGLPELTSSWKKWNLEEEGTTISITSDMLEI